MLHGTKLEAFGEETLEKLDILRVSPAGQTPSWGSPDATRAFPILHRPVRITQALLLALLGCGY